MTLDDEIPPVLGREGVQKGTERAPENEEFREWLAGRCEEYERIIRLQDEAEDAPFELTERDEKALAAPKRSTQTITGALRRFAYLKHLYLTRDENDGRRWSGRPPGSSAAESDPDVEETARKLLQREPVEVQLSGRTVEVTGRSYACMMHMARHETRVEELQLAVRRARQIRRETSDAIEAGEGSALRLRRRYERLGRIVRLLVYEMNLHRQAIYAHALTDDGAPADSLEDAPDWWREMDPAQDAILLMGLFEAGPARIDRLGPPPDSGDGGEARGENWGFKSLIASVERRQGVEPATYFNKDLGQIVTWVRAGAPPPPKDLEG